MQTRVIGPTDALALIERDEDHFWDHKSALSNGAVIQKIAAVLANADGGEFAVGIEDRGKAVGLDRWAGFKAVEDATLVLEAMSRDIAPPVPYQVEFLQVQGREAQGLVCLVTVGKSESVHETADHRVWIRRGASTVQLTGQSITDLSLAKGARSYEDQLLGDYTVDDVAAKDELSFFLSSYSPSTQARPFLERQRLVDRQSGQARVSCAVLYSENPPAVMPKRCGVKVARYQTKDLQPRREHLVGTPTTIEGPARVVIDESLRAVTEMIQSPRCSRTGRWHLCATRRRHSRRLW